MIYYSCSKTLTTKLKEWLTLKKFLSLILSILLIFTLTVPAFASGTVKQTCPTIYIHGFMGSKICEDKNDISTKYTFPSGDEILEPVKYCNR